MSARIDPEPAPEEREAILAAIARRDLEQPSGWAEAALAEGVEQDEPDP